MSTGFDIMFAPGELFKSQPLNFYAHTLKLVLETPGVRRASVVLTVYRGQRPFDSDPRSGDPHIIFDDKIDGERVFEKIAQIRDAHANNDEFFLGVTCVYDLLKWDNDICDYEGSAGCLSLEYESPCFDGGHGSRSHGPFRIHFYEHKLNFSPTAVDLSRCPANPLMLTKLIEFGRNFSFLRGLFLDIAREFRPEYLFVVDEGDHVHPLNFHMVYHNTLSGYLFDAQKILQMHILGGGYFYEGRMSDRDLPYNSLGVADAAYEKDFLTAEDAALVAEKLDFFIAKLGTKSLSEVLLSDQDIHDLLSAATVAEVEAVGESLALFRTNFVGYLEQPYLDLLDWAVTETSVIS